MRILSILPVVGHPRDSKRISMLQESGFEVEVAAFERGYHAGRMPTCVVKPLGKISNGKYLARIFKFVFALPKLRRAIKNNDVIYASGADMALFAIVSSIGLSKKVIVECGDIRAIQVSNGIPGKLMRSLDRFIGNKCELIVATASDFIDEYYRKWLKVNTLGIVIENKLEKINLAERTIKESAPKGTDTKLRIGYFGVLRSLWSMRVLIELAKIRPKDIEIVIAGIPLLSSFDLLEMIKDYPNIKYVGKYRSPEDLPSLYGMVDVMWACYPDPDVNNKNWEWAQLICRSNRFYESCYWSKPIITMKGSGDAKEVEKFQIGKVISFQNQEDILEQVLSISDIELTFWKSNMDSLPESVYLYTSEADQLRKSIYEINKNSN